MPVIDGFPGVWLARNWRGGGAEDRVDDIAVCDSLVELGHAARVEGDEFEGQGYRGYVLSEEMAEAHRLLIADGANQAWQN